MFSGRQSGVTTSFITPTGADLRRGGNAMKRAYVKNKQGAWLVEGSIGGVKFHGHGRPFAFKQKDADLLCEAFGFTQQAAEGTEQQVQPDGADKPLAG